MGGMGEEEATRARPGEREVEAVAEGALLLVIAR
jgi:hypothetical protein